MTAATDEDCDCNICRGGRATTPNQRRIARLEAELADARVQVALLEGDLAVAVEVATRRGAILRAVKPLVGVTPEKYPVDSTGRPPLILSWEPIR